MTDYLNEDYKISISDIAKHIIKKWWLLILSAATIASVCVGFKYITTASDNAVDSSNNSTSDSLYNSYTLGQANMSNEIQKLYEKADRMNNYTENSIYYNLDPTSFHVSVATFELSTAETSGIEQIYNSYLYDITNGAYLSELAEELSIEEVYLRETVRVSGFDSAIFNSDNAYAYSSLIIAVYGEDFEYTNYVLDRIIEEIPSITESVSLTFSHQCVLLTRNQATKIEGSLRADQAATDSYIADLYTKINNISNNMQNIPEPEASSNGTQSLINGKTIVKYGGIGAVLGVILAVGIIVLLYLLDGTVSDDARFRNRYNVMLLGKSDAMIIANIKNYLGDKSDVVVTGTATESIIRDRINIYQKEFEGIRIFEATDMLGNANSRAMLVNSNNIVLIEEINKSKYVDIDEELAVLSSMGKTVIGVILV